MLPPLSLASSRPSLRPWSHPARPSSTAASLRMLQTDPDSSYGASLSSTKFADENREPAPRNYAKLRETPANRALRGIPGARSLAKNSPTYRRRRGMNAIRNIEGTSGGSVDGRHNSVERRDRSRDRRQICRDINYYT